MRTGWRVHAWVLMSNHYHLMLETPEPNLSQGMKWLQNTYRRRFNSRHRLWGRLFGDRYKAVLSEGKAGYYYCSLMDYIHLNPVRLGLVRMAQGTSVRDYAWSSVAAGYAIPAAKRPPWLAAAEGLAMAQCSDTAAGRRRFVEHLDGRAREEGMRGAGVVTPEDDRRRSHLRHGWYWGSQTFAERMLKLAKGAGARDDNRTYRSAPLSRAHDERREAERILGILGGRACRGGVGAGLGVGGGKHARRPAWVRRPQKRRWPVCSWSGRWRAKAGSQSG